MIAALVLAGVMFSFTPSADAPPAIHVCRAWEFYPVAVAPDTAGPCRGRVEGGSCWMMRGPVQIPCSIGGTILDFPDPRPGGVTFATVYAIWQ